LFDGDHLKWNMHLNSIQKLIPKCERKNMPPLLRLIPISNRSRTCFYILIQTTSFSVAMSRGYRLAKSLKAVFEEKLRGGNSGSTRISA